MATEIIGRYLYILYFEIQTYKYLGEREIEE